MLSTMRLSDEEEIKFVRQAEKRNPYLGISTTKVLHPIALHTTGDTSTKQPLQQYQTDSSKKKNGEPRCCLNILPIFIL